MEIRRIQSDRGASLTEYAVLVAFLVVAAIPALAFLEGGTAGAFETHAVAIGEEASGEPTPGPAPSPPSPTPPTPSPAPEQAPEVPPETPNVAPTAAFTSTCSYLECTFTSTSTDPDGTVDGWQWTFGDGGSSSGPTSVRTFSAPGSYVVQLTVTDDDGAIAVAEQTVDPVRAAVQAAVSVTVRSAGGNRFYEATVALSAEDGTLPIGATVRGRWTGDDALIECKWTGTACVTPEWKSGAGSKTFTVESIGHPGWDGVKASGSVTG